MVREPFAPPSPDTPVSETAIDVRTSELDSFGHVNHAVYLTYFEHARFRALSEAGFDWDVLAERGWAIFVVRIEVDYVAEATREDRLLIRTWADSFRRTSMVLGQVMVRADDPDLLVAQARVTAAWIGSDRRPTRVPLEVREGLSERRSHAPGAVAASDRTAPGPTSGTFDSSDTSDTSDTSGVATGGSTAPASPAHSSSDNGEPPPPEQSE